MFFLHNFYPYSKGEPPSSITLPPTDFPARLLSTPLTFHACMWRVHRVNNVPIKSSSTPDHAQCYFTSMFGGKVVIYSMVGHLPYIFNGRDMWNLPKAYPIIMQINFIWFTSIEVMIVNILIIMLEVLFFFLLLCSIK